MLLFVSNAEFLYRFDADSNILNTLKISRVPDLESTPYLKGKS